MLSRLAHQLRRRPSWLLLGLLLPWCLVACQLSSAQAHAFAPAPLVAQGGVAQCHGQASQSQASHGQEASSQAEVARLDVDAAAESCADCDESLLQLPQPQVWLAPLMATEIWALLPSPLGSNPVLAVRGADPPGYPPRYLRLEVFRL